MWFMARLLTVGITTGSEASNQRLMSVNCYIKDTIFNISKTSLWARTYTYIWFGFRLNFV